MKLLKIGIKNLKEALLKLNYGVLLIMLGLCVFGILMIYSASSVSALIRYGVSTNHFLIKQLLITILGFGAGLVILAIPTKYYRFIAKPAIYLMIFILVALFFKGVVAGGAQSWFDLGTANFQPSELTKLFLIIYLSVVYNKISKMKKPKFLQMLYPLFISAIIIILVIAQPDLGGAIIFLTIVGLIFISLPICKEYKKQIYKVGAGMVVVLALAVLLFGKSLLHSYQVERITNFRNPCQRYTESSGYQVCNGYIAIRDGGLLGVGLGESTQKRDYLPEAHTDFIFPIIVEECGLIVGIVIILLYFVLLLLILGISKETDNLRNSILAYGIFAYLLSHILINILGVLGLIPLTGVPLPFLSYGGSFGITVILSIFIVLRISVENKKDKQLRKIKEL